MEYGMSRRYGNNRGQTLVIAIMVMFILAVIAAVFMAMVANNLFRSQRFSNTDAVAQLAEAGVRFADQMLTSSDDGADWRPLPDNLGSQTAPIPNPATGVQPVPDLGWTTAQANNPDFQWTRPYWPTELGGDGQPGSGYAGPTGGYTTFDSGQGRFLLRISYNPDPTDPMSKYIKIESIGRWGVLLNGDPTTLNPEPGAPPRMRREITAFKPIGITDYARFVTNKENRSLTFTLGCPGFDTEMGRFSSGQSSWVRAGR